LEHINAFYAKPGSKKEGKRKRTKGVEFIVGVARNKPTQQFFNRQWTILAAMALMDLHFASIFANPPMHLESG